MVLEWVDLMDLFWFIGGLTGWVGRYMDGWMFEERCANLLISHIFCMIPERNISHHYCKWCLVMWPNNAKWNWRSGVTKPIPSFLLFSQSFSTVETHISYWISHLYLTGVTAAQLQWHLSNINMIQRFEQVVPQDRKFYFHHDSVQGSCCVSL